MVKNYLTCFFIFAAVTTSFASSDDESHMDPKCSNIQRHEIENHLSTKTPYRVVANKEDSPLQYPGKCYMKISQIFLMEFEDYSKFYFRL